MKGVEIPINMIVIIVLLLLAAAAIFFLLNYFGVNLATPLCRTFCIPISSVIGDVMRALLIGYVLGAPGSTMCNFCG